MLELAPGLPPGERPPQASKQAASSAPCCVWLPGTLGSLEAKAASQHVRARSCWNWEQGYL